MRPPPGSPWLAGLLDDLALFERLGETDSQARTLAKIARLAIGRGEASRAIRSCRFGLEAAGDDAALAAELWGLAGHALALRGHARPAIGCYRHAADGFRRAGCADRAAAAETASAILVGVRDPDDARRRLRAVLAEASAASTPEVFASALAALGEIDLRAGDPGRAALCARFADEALQRSGRPASADVASLRGRACAATGDVDGARAALQEALARLGPHAPGEARARILEVLAWVQIDAGATPEARRSLAEGLALARRDAARPDHALLARLSVALAWASEEDNRAEALRHLAAALDSIERLAAPPLDLLDSAREVAARLPPAPPVARLLRTLDEARARAR